MLAHAVLPEHHGALPCSIVTFDERTVGFVMAGVGICAMGAGRIDRPGQSSASASAGR
jgi:hypothetical protein